MSYSETRVSLARRGSRPVRVGRRLAALLAAIAMLVVGVILLAPLLGNTLQRLTLPLEDTAVIRTQAAEKHLDPALVAAVIYAESKFDPRESSAGAQGLMQILPETATFIARRTGGIDFTTADLATPSVNVAYGSWYLRYLLDHYGGAELPAIAAYNAGLGKVDEWVASAREEGRSLAASDIPYPETRAYVERVLAAQQAYRSTYAAQLGLR
jgi:soluble lytic murein transglycosylase